MKNRNIWICSKKYEVFENLKIFWFLGSLRVQNGICVFLAKIAFWYPKKSKNDSERIRTTYPERNFLGRAQLVKNRLLCFFAVFRVFLRFLRFFALSPQVKILKIDQKIDFPKIVSKHVLMANMVLKHV